MKKETFIFIGASGCGKGTQVELLKGELARRDPGSPVFYLQTGQLFREFAKGENFAARITKEVQERGELLPEFLSMWLWSDAFVKNLTGNEHLIIDGSPRTADEAHHLDIALQFFKRGHPTVIYMRVSREWSLTRMKERAAKEHRADDSEASMARRLSWFEKAVLPMVEQYRLSAACPPERKQMPPRADHEHECRFLEVNGEQSITEVHREIVAKVFGT